MTVLEEPLKGIMEIRNYIDGKLDESEGETLEVINPALFKKIGEVPDSTTDEVDSAVDAARNAFEDWGATPPVTRARCLFRLKELLEENFERLSRIQTMEHGKTIDESRGETRRGIEMVEVATGIPSLLMGRNLKDVAAGVDEYLYHQPLGVFGIIPAFNFPFMVPLWFAPFAVATGNCIVIKPSPRTPITQTILSELVEEAGFPPGVWNVVHGGERAASRLIDHKDTKGAAFVGSTSIGREVYRKCGEAGKRAIVQGSAKNFLVVMEDADRKKTILSLISSFYGNTGQRCLAGSNLIIVGKDDGFYRSFVGKFVEESKKIRVGYGLDESVQMGPLQSVQGKERVKRFIETGLNEGAKIRLDGREPKIIGNYPAECYLGPTVFEGVTTDMKIGKEEIFGPVASVMRAENLDEAIEMVNTNQYGNAAAIFTKSGRAAKEFQSGVEAGNIGINLGVPAPMAIFPFCGMKSSFLGILHGQGQEAIRFFTENKLVIERWF
jgi:malonate-semialdehyde dehydrogenase (acetylating)/methylmalonate-semialdehyde dehydrogenase